MCPIWPLHLVILYLLALAPMWVFCQQLPGLTARFMPEKFTVHMSEDAFVNVSVSGKDLLSNDTMELRTEDNHTAEASWNSTYQVKESNTSYWSGIVKVHGKMIGRTRLKLTVNRGLLKYEITNGSLPITVTRPERVIDKVFTYSVIIFVSLIFINFGCAMHWPTVKEVLKKPIGPVIGMVGQFLFMPLISFGLGYLIFPQSPAMRLGMFFTGVSPGGGASNIWIYILGGNLNLSLAMTTISNLASFVFMPAWLFSLGQVVFAKAKISVPYVRIAEFLVCLFVPLALGLSMQRWTPRVASFMVRILKAFSATLLIFIIAFAIATNLYIFELFTWEIIVAGIGIPWLGYVSAYILARILRQPHADSLAISIETGVQNTGIAIFLLRYALEQPEADWTTVVPVSVAIMTPIPMTCLYIYQKVRECIVSRKANRKIADLPEATTNTDIGMESSRM